MWFRIIHHAFALVFFHRLFHDVIFLLFLSFFVLLIWSIVEILISLQHPWGIIFLSVYLNALSQVFRICLVRYGSLPSSGVMDGVRKSLGIVLYGYSSGRLVVSPPPIPSSLVKCLKNGIVPSAFSSCVNLMLFVLSTLFRWSVRCCVISVFITSSMSST